MDIQVHEAQISLTCSRDIFTKLPYKLLKIKAQERILKAQQKTKEKNTHHIQGNTHKATSGFLSRKFSHTGENKVCSK